MNLIPWILLLLLIAIQCVTIPALLKRSGLSFQNTIRFSGLRKNLTDENDAEKDTPNAPSKSFSFFGFIPILHFIPMLKIIGRPWYWFLLLLVPGVNLIMLVIVNVEMGIVFNQRSAGTQWKFGALPWYALYQLAFQNKEEKYVGPRNWNGKKKSWGREWGEAILFAVVAASIIRSFTFEAFTIPTPSMESSMKVGDYLFVDKFTYGTRLPMTPVSIPFFHNAIPGGLTNSYLDWFSLPYMRTPGFGKVERFDPVVFNFPNGDTVLIDPYYVGHNYYELLRNEAITLAGNNVDLYLSDKAKYEAMARNNFNEKKVCKSCRENTPGGKGNLKIGGTRFRPLDKKEMYIKRCIGLPWETLEVRDGQVYINGSAIENKAGMMWNYHIIIPSASTSKLQREFGKLESEIQQINQEGTEFLVPLTTEEANKMRGMTSDFTSVVQFQDTTSDHSLSIYPNSADYPFSEWTSDRFGPLAIPAEGMTIEMTHDAFVRYGRVIGAYEGNSIQEKDGKIFINGQEAATYTFKQNYYFMMGDNRHHSADSRFWGFVPEDHIVGKAVFTWFSKENMDYHGSNTVRWERIFRLVD